MAELSCININFDSFGWALGLPPGRTRDPSFFEVADRFFAISDRMGFKYTIYVIGRDLENPEVAARVRDWHDRGHEIGNHSYSHLQNLGYLGDGEIESEVMRSHELIARACGRAPRGFIAPAWATSPALLRVLIRNRYLYDTSLLPSYFMWLASAKVWWNFRGDERQKSVLQRKDRLANLIGRRRPFFTDGASLTPQAAGGGLLVIPLPVTPVFRLPLWHTMAFFFPRWIFDHVLRTTLRMRFFYYLVHPSDLADLDDIPAGYMESSRVLEKQRMAVPVAEKIRQMETFLAVVKERSGRIVTLETIAQALWKEKQGAP